MDVKIGVSEKNPDIKVVILSGRLDVESAEKVSPTFLQAVEESLAGVIFDMGGVVFISSAGFRTLLVTYKQADAAGKKIALIHTQSQVYKIFKVAAFDEVFNIFEDEDQAIKALWK